MRDSTIMPVPVATDPVAVFERLAAQPTRNGRLTHLERWPARDGRPVDWPSWTPPELVERLMAYGVQRPWSHQARTAELAWAGRHVVVSTGTGSGKSLGYLLPGLSTIAGSASGKGSRSPTVLYIAPTKALAHDQLAVLDGIDRAVDDGASRTGLAGLRGSSVDGDTSRDERDWAREHATWVVTNPDMLHRSILPSHSRWARLLGSLAYVVVDECHHYRGVFGSHVAQVLRRLRRIADHYGASPTFVLASATVAEPDVCASTLTGLTVEAVSDDGSPRGPGVLALWEPPLSAVRGEHDAPTRRSAPAESADLLSDLVVDGMRALVFVRSRRAAETVALSARRMLADVDPSLADSVAAYRGGYLAEDRRELEHGLRTGRLLGAATTSALELGIDLVGLDAVLVAGFPGTRAALWQQLGRAGRRGRPSVGVLVARDDPLDTYLVRHPEALLGKPLEATVSDPDNPYVLGPHLCAAAQELALTDDDLALFGPNARAGVDALTADGMLRRRPRGWFWTRRERACDLADIRSSGGTQVQVVEHPDGRVLGTVDAGAAHTSVHTGAVYLHQGRTYLVRELDLTTSVALVERADPDWTTTAREVTDIEVVGTTRNRTVGSATVEFGSVRVTSQVVGYLRRRLFTGEVLGEEPLDLPQRQLTTTAVWWTLGAARVAGSAVDPKDLPGAAHAAEHAAIGLLPLFATCDRWDIGGVSTALHRDTGRLTVFVYDGHPGGAGFAERGYAVVEQWLATTRAAIASCECRVGCPSCVQSPKCGNGNEPLHKAGAVALLDVLLTG